VPATRPPLDYALLGLLNQEPASGYALRRIFQTTPLRIYSDSPGSIYPALRRLHRLGLVAAARERSGRHRRTYRITPAGRRLLRRWLEAPLMYEEVASGHGGPELRLAFLSDVAGPDRVRSFLTAYARALDRVHDELTKTRALLRTQLSASGTIALELGITLTRARAESCRRAARRIRSRP
jgi:DNA-binding PadR family transcriptional regulator